MHLHFRVPIKIPITLSEHWISHSARFKNTMIEILKTSTDPQVPKGVDALKQLLFLKKRRIKFPVVVPASKIACALNPCSWPGWNRHLVNSAASQGQDVVKCVLNPGIVAALNPHYLPPSCGGRGALPPFCLNFVFARWILIVSRHFEINLYCMRQTGASIKPGTWNIPEHSGTFRNMKK